MNKEKLLKKLEEIKSYDGDAETAHGDADQALLDFIDDEKVKEVYHSINKWYA